MHRDNNDSNRRVISIFSAGTPITENNGAVRVYLNSSEWIRNYRLGTKDKLRRHQGYKFVDMMGDQCDIFAFDGRLLHQSVRKTTEGDVHIVFAFTLYDSAK